MLKKCFYRINNSIKFHKRELNTNQACKARPETINFNSNNPVFYPFSIKTNKYSGNCNNIDNPHAKICVPDVVKDLNIKVFNLMSRTNETRHIKWHETCRCICRLDAIARNNNVGMSMRMKRINWKRCMW